MAGMALRESGPSCLCRLYGRGSVVRATVLRPRGPIRALRQSPLKPAPPSPAVAQIVRTRNFSTRALPIQNYIEMAEDAAGPPTGAPAEGETGPDGEIVGGPRNMQQIAAQRRLMQQQAQVDEVVDIMKTNVEKVLDRDAKLSELDDRANALQQGASQFEQQAKSLKNKFWLQNLKMMIIMGVIGIVIIGLLFVRYRGTPTMSGVVASAPMNATAPSLT